MTKNENPNNLDSTMDDDSLWTASATDMTGLIPSGITDDAEVENYENVYPFLTPTGTMIKDPPISEIMLENELRHEARATREDTSQGL